MRNICVKGNGIFTAKPDTVRINFQLDIVRKEYQKALDAAEQKLEAVRQAAESVGIKRSELKTSNFNVSRATENQREANGNYKTVFAGYRCNHAFNLSFGYDTVLLGELIAAIASRDAEADFTIQFTVADLKKAKEELLKSAIQDARHHASVLAQAAGLTLGEIQSIQYHVDDKPFFSDTQYRPMALKASRAVNFEPEDVKQSDSVTVIWEIR